MYSIFFFALSSLVDIVDLKYNLVMILLDHEIYLDME